MHVLIVYAHPNPKAFCRAVLERFSKGLQDGGHSHEVIDLHAIDFDPVFTMADYGQFYREDVPAEILESWKPKELIMDLAGGPIKRFLARQLLKDKTALDLVGFIRKNTPKDVLAHQAKLAKADGLVYIFPLYWNNFPAILLGWMQRVLTYGFAYRMSPEGWAGDVSGRVSLLTQKKALIMNTTFFSEEDLKTRGFHDAMLSLMDDWGLRYPGISDVTHEFFYSVPSVGDETRAEYLQRAYQLGKEF